MEELEISPNSKVEELRKEKVSSFLLERSPYSLQLEFHFVSLFIKHILHSSFLFPI